MSKSRWIARLVCRGSRPIVLLAMWIALCDASSAGEVSQNFPLDVAANSSNPNRSRAESLSAEPGASSSDGLDLPSVETIRRVFTLQDYNTRVVVFGTLMLGITSGCIGTFVLLRKRSLVGDVVGHASLPGIAFAFIVMQILSPGAERSLPILLLGATIAGLAGVLVMSFILRTTRIKEDAALAMVLSVFFGLGMVLFTVIQNIPNGHSAGLTKFIFGTAASMIASDVWLIGSAAAIVLVGCALLYKELSLLCFDESYAASQGWPTALLDLLLMGFVVAVAEIGAQSVGLILVVALMIIPASAARFWTEDLTWMTLIAGFLGGASALIGVLISALMPRLAAGATIVLVGGAFFSISMIWGAKRGIFWRVYALQTLRRRVGRHDLLRTFYELGERSATTSQAGGQTLEQISFSLNEVLAMRSWSTAYARRLIARASRSGLLSQDVDDRCRLTARGLAEAHRAARNHRMWELYLIEHAEIAPNHVDRDADQIEHILAPEVVFELEQLIAKRYPEMQVPPSPHQIDFPNGSNVT